MVKTLTVQCPFFKFERGMKLHCEGGVVCFLTARHRCEYLEKYCANLEGHKKCSIADEVYKEYEKNE